VLMAHSWPGNVRELENLVKRLAALYAEEVVGADAITHELLEQSEHPAPEGGSRSENLTDAVDRHLRTYFAAHEDELPDAGLYERIIREVGRPLIAQSLEATNGNQLRAAALLGLNRNTLRKKIRELDIPVVRGLK
jgi:two-component system nitrogen regulation response regulator GlnG